MVAIAIHLGVVVHVGEDREYRMFPVKDVTSWAIYKLAKKLGTHTT